MRSNAGIRAVVFDVDDVLVETRFATALPKMLHITPEDAKQFYEGSFLDCLVGGAQLCDVLPSYLDQWGWKGTFEEFTKLWFEIESHINRPALSLVDRLRKSGLHCYLASTQEQLRARHLEQLLDVGGRFERAFFSCVLGCKKPDRKFFEAVTTGVGRRPQEILLVDDQQANVEGASAMGWNAVRYRFGVDELQVIDSALGTTRDA